MAGPVFRTALISLLACGAAGALLYSVQPRPPRITPADLAPTPSPPAARTHARSHIRSPQLSETDLFRGMGPPTLRATASAPPRNTTAALAAPSEDLDLNDPALHLPLARLALASVGLDDLSEQLWLRAINDPDIDAEDRANLIEDLNEDGFADPKNLTKDDLPLIEARLALIARLAPDAMDNSNAAAFEEARKDLLEMHRRLTEPGAQTSAAPATPEPAPTEPPR